MRWGRGEKLLSWAVKLVVVNLGNPLPCLSNVTLASVPLDAGRTSPDTDVSPLALKVKWSQGLQFELCVNAICLICLWQRSISPRGGPLSRSRSRCVCVWVLQHHQPHKLIRDTIFNLYLASHRNKFFHLRKGWGHSNILCGNAVHAPNLSLYYKMSSSVVSYQLVSHHVNTKWLYSEIFS